MQQKQILFEDVCNLLYERRNITGEQLKKENIGDSCMGGLHSRPPGPSRTAVKISSCISSKQDVAPLQLEGNKKKPRGCWEDCWGRLSQRPLCASFKWSDIQVREARSIHPVCTSTRDWWMTWPIEWCWSGDRAPLINRLRGCALLCHQHEVHFFIISEPQIINTHKSNDAWLLLQSLSH